MWISRGGGLGLGCEGSVKEYGRAWDVVRIDRNSRCKGAILPIFNGQHLL